jgi:hypothetical protein
MPLPRKPGRAKTYAEDARCLLIIAAGHSVRVRQLGAHRWVTPVGLPRPPCIDGPGFDKRSGRLGLAQGLSLCIAAHSRRPAPGIEAIEGTKKRIAVNISAETLNMPVAGQSLEG